MAEVQASGQNGTVCVYASDQQAEIASANFLTPCKVLAISKL
jgi:hypothetical protein